MENVPLDMQRLEQALASAQNRAWSLVQYGLRCIQRVEESSRGEIEASRRRLKELVAGLPVETAGGWYDLRWEGWDAGSKHEDPLLRIGDLVDAKSKLTLPGYVPFIGRNKTIVISCDELTAELG